MSIAMANCGVWEEISINVPSAPVVKGLCLLFTSCREVQFIKCNMNEICSL